MSAPAIPAGALLSPAPGSVGTWTELKVIDGLSFDSWQELLEKVLRFAGASAWWIGDALVYGEWSYGERYREVIDRLEIDYDRARDYAYVAGNVPPSIRRPDLTFYHHRAVARLVPDEQERWLARAATDGLSVRQLRDAIAEATALPRNPPPPQELPEHAVLEVVRFVVPPDRLERWSAAAERAGLSVQEWATTKLDEAADQ